MNSKMNDKLIDLLKYQIKTYFNNIYLRYYKDMPEYSQIVEGNKFDVEDSLD